MRKVRPAANGPGRGRGAWVLQYPGAYHGLDLGIQFATDLLGKIEHGIDAHGFGRILLPEIGRQAADQPRDRDQKQDRDLVAEDEFFEGAGALQ